MVLLSHLRTKATSSLSTLGICACVLAPLSLCAQTQVDVITGRVSMPDGTPVRAARTIVTRGPDRAVFEALSNEDGRFRIEIDSGTGDYLVYVAAPQALRLQPFRLRLTRQRASDSVFVVAVVLKSAEAVQQLSTVRVQERKPTPTRVDGLRVGPGGREEAEPGVAAALLPDQRGDLGALGATLAGATPVSGGVSVFGLSAAQNSVTLNGLAFAGASIPRDARTFTRVATAAYDPSRGWFGGAETRVELSHDLVFATRTTSTSLDAPAWQAATIAARMGQYFTNVTQGAEATGATARGLLTYNVSAQAGRLSSDVLTLADLNQDLLHYSGVSVDSGARLVQLARIAGLPMRAPGTPAGRTTNRASLLLGVSTLANDRDSFRVRRHLGSLTVYASHDATEGAGLHTLTAAAAGRREQSSNATVQGAYSTYLAPGVLLDLRSGLSVGRQQISPYLALPAARVLVGSSLTDSPGGLTVLAIGGAPSGDGWSRAITWETQASTRLYASPAHRLNIGADVRFDAVSRHTRTNTHGTFAFSSLSDFAENRPTVFTRTFGTEARSGSVWNAFVSVGDYWRVTPGLEVLYGARVEGNTYTERPPFNPAVNTTFGVRTDYVPNTLHVSPRFGFSWRVRQSPSGGNSVRTDHGVFVPPAAGVLRGGIGEFRAILAPSLLANATGTGGLLSGTRELTCAGSAVPTPDWHAYLTSLLAVPEACASGSSTDAFRDEASPVRLLAPDFTAPRSWRANLSWTSHIGTAVWSVDGIYSLNLNQPGFADLNFRDTPVALLPSEGDRPLYVPVSQIVPTSGVVFGRDARRSAAYGPVMQARSNLRSEVSQVTISVLPDLSRYARARMFASLSYTYAHARAVQGGYDGSTFASPLSRVWSRSPFTPTHSFIAQASARRNYLTIGLFARIASGLPFTPMVGSDINGDGLANDRAFVFDEAGAPDQTAAAAMRALLDGSSHNVRSCLRRQVGQAASANSCNGPWSATMNARVHWSTSGSAGWARRVNVALYFANPLAGLDQLLHGERRRGWGGTAIPDQTLLRVLGFEPELARFKYAVNPRFGDTRSAGNLLGAPFRVTLDIRLDLGRPPDEQILERSIQPGRGGHSGPKRTAEQIRLFYQRTLPQPFAQVLALTDSLLLTTDQVRALLDGQARYVQRADSAVMAFSVWLAALPDRYDAAEALRRQNALVEMVLNIGQDEVQRTMGPTLNAIQVRLLPWPVDLMYRSSVPLTLREVRR